MNNLATLCKITEPFTIGDDKYDLSDLRRIHRVWTPVMWTSESLHRIDDDTFLSVSRSPLRHRQDTADVFVTSRVSAIDAAIRTNAPDSVLEELGVEIRSEPESPRPFDRASLRTRLIAAHHPNPFWFSCLYVNYDGSYVNNRLISLEPLLFYQDWSRPFTQRQAIRFALKRQRTEDALGLLGVRF